MTTLDSRHTEKKKYFDSLQKKLPKLKKKLERDKAKLQKITQDSTIPMESIYKMENSITSLEQEIKRIESKEEELEYYKQSSSLLYNYYNEHGKTTSAPSTIATNNVMKYFKTQPTSAPIPTINKTDIIDKYNALIDPSCLKHEKCDTEYYMCKKCNVEKIINTKDALIICEKCGIVEQLFIDSDNPNYKNPPLDSSNIYSYRRINHLHEWLSKFQAKETIDIPDEVFDKLYAEIKKERITDLKKITRLKIRDYLKKLKLNKYYEHAPYILYRINGVVPPRITKQLEEKLEEMFKDIEDVFVKISPNKMFQRKNFLSYPYVLYKLMEMHDLNDYKQCFPLLKSRDNLRKQDLIWCTICSELGWKFIKSV